MQLVTYVQYIAHLLRAHPTDNIQHIGCMGIHLDLRLNCASVNCREFVYICNTHAFNWCSWLLLSQQKKCYLCIRDTSKVKNANIEPHLWFRFFYANLLTGIFHLPGLFLFVVLFISTLDHTKLYRSWRLRIFSHK